MTAGRCLSGVRVAIPVLAGLAATIHPALPAASDQPTITLSDTTLVPGRAIGIIGKGWALDTQIQVQLCGRLAIEGSADCAEDAAATMSPGPDGSIIDHMVVEKPPVPCPCVVLVQTVSGSFSTSMPVTVVDVPLAPVPALPPSPTLAVSAAVTGGLSFGSLFGVGTRRTLVLTIRNTGTGPEKYPVLSARWGRRGHTDTVISSPVVKPLDAGATAHVALPFSLDPLSHGSYVVSGTVTGTAQSVAFSSRTSTEPWGLIGLAVLVFQATLLAIRNRVRRRIAKPLRAEPSPPSEPDAAGPSRAGVPVS